MIPTSPAAELTQLIDSFSGRKVLLVGDLVADHYIHGKSSRISREAPVIILKYQSESVIPGQAGNTAANIAALAFYRANGFAEAGATANCGAAQSGIPALGLEKMIG